MTDKEYTWTDKDKVVDHTKEVKRLWDLVIPETEKYVKKFRTNGVKYGWWWGEAPTEDWHFTYDIKRDTFLEKKDTPINNKVTKSKNAFFTYIPYFLIGVIVPVGAYFLVKTINKIK